MAARAAEKSCEDWVVACWAWVGVETPGVLEVGAAVEVIWAAERPVMPPSVVAKAGFAVSKAMRLALEKRSVLEEKDILNMDDLEGRAGTQRCADVKKMRAAGEGPLQTGKSEAGGFCGRAQWLNGLDETSRGLCDVNELRAGVGAAGIGEVSAIAVLSEAQM